MSCQASPLVTPVEPEPDAAVDYPPLKWRPGINRPCPVGRALRQEQRNIFGLPAVQKIFGVDEQAAPAKDQLAHRTEIKIGLRARTAGNTPQKLTKSERRREG